MDDWGLEVEAYECLEVELRAGDNMQVKVLVEGCD